MEGNIMKKNTTILCALLVSGAIVSCQKEENATVPEQDNLIRKTITISDEPWTADSQTKSLYEKGVGVHLNKLENMSVYYWKWAADAPKPVAEKNVLNTLTVTVNNNTNITGAEAKEAGKWNFSHPAIEGATSYNYYFIIPHNSTNALNSQKTGHSFRLSPIQFPEILNKFSGCEDSPLSFDPTSDCHMGQAQMNVDIQTEVSELHFKRVFAPLRLTIKDSKGLLGDDVIYSVTLSSKAGMSQQQVLTGIAYFNHSDIFEEATISSFGKDQFSNAVSTLYKNKPLQKDKNTSCYTTWFIVNPTTLPAADLTLSVTTAQRTYTRTVAANEIKVLENTINDLSFDISKENVTSSVSDFYDFEFDKLNEITTVSGSNTAAKPWKHTSCDLIKDVGNSKYNNAFRIKTRNTSILAYTAIEGKKLSKVRFYGHPRSTNTSTVCVKRGETEIGKINMGYNSIASNGGFGEIEIPDAYSSADLTFSITDNAALISAVVLFFEEDSTTGDN